MKTSKRKSLQWYVRVTSLFAFLLFLTFSYGQGFTTTSESNSGNLIRVQDNVSVLESCDGTYDVYVELTLLAIQTDGQNKVKNSIETIDIYSKKDDVLTTLKHPFVAELYGINAASDNSIEFST